MKFKWPGGQKEEEKDVQRCIECGKIIKDKKYEPYCKDCDEKLDKQFDNIEDNIVIFRDLRDSEIETLKKFDDEDIKDLFKKVYNKFSGEKGGFKKESIAALNKLKDSFRINELDLGLKKIPGIKEIKKGKYKDKCPGCGKKIQEDFNLCPYCGYKLKDEF
ncbi:MAG: zinc ribbon domain-containing protein [Actinomycetota bacterium]|nr:zinc ribbon domain-containing protein [Actinomycetota bacterium]